MLHTAGLREAEPLQRRKRKARVHAANAVDDLCDAEVDDDAGEGKRFLSLQSELPFHQIEHSVERLDCGLIQVLVESEGEPRCRGQGLRCDECEVVADGERQLYSLERTLDRHLPDFPVTLGRVTVARGEQRSLDGDREQEPRSFDELLAVEVAARCSGRHRRVRARLVWRHPKDAEKWTQLDLPTHLIACDLSSAVQFPLEEMPVEIG